MRRRLGCILVLAACLARAETGTLHIPVKQLLSMDEGTIEFWVKPTVDLKGHLPSTERYVGLMTLFQLQGEYGRLSMSQFAGAMYKPEAGLFISMESDKAKLEGLAAGVFLPEPETWYHLAVVWQGRDLRCYVNGEITGRQAYPQPLQAVIGLLGETPMSFGDKWHQRGRFVLDEIRFSTIAREVEDLGFHGELEPDPYTSLLEGFEATFEPNGRRRTQPAVLLSGDGPLPSSHCTFVPGKFGQGLSLDTAE